MSIFQGAFLCTAGQGTGLRACAVDVASSVFAGVFSVWGPPKLTGVGLDVTAAAAAGRGLPGCLRGQGELPGAWFGGQPVLLETGELSCRVDTKPLRDTVSPGCHLGSYSAADAFHWETHHQTSMLLDSKWLWSSCTYG